MITFHHIFIGYGGFVLNTSANPRRKHLGALDGIRSFACLEIFCCHCLWKGGALGVSLFLILSGFLLSYRYLPQNTAAALPDVTPSGLVRFAWKRLSKLYPLHIIMMAVVIIVQLVQGEFQNNDDWTVLFVRIILHVFMVQTWVPVDSFYYSLNGLSWYLSTIQFCYLCFPLLLRLLKKLDIVKGMLFSLIVVFVVQVCIARISLTVFGISDTGHYYLTYVCPLFRIFDFVCGCLLGAVFSKLPTLHKNMLWHTVWEVLAVFAVGITQFLALNNYVFVWGRFSMIFLPACCFAIFVFAVGGGYISRVFNAKIIKLFAGITPFIFLIHNQIIAGVLTFLSMFGLGGQKHLVALISFAVTVLMACLYDTLLKKKKARS